MRCNSNRLVTDMDSAEIFCSNCGFVVAEKLQRFDRERRAFTNDEFFVRAHTGAPTSLTIHDMGLATIIDSINRDAADKPLKQTMRYEMKRLRRLDNRSQFHTQTHLNRMKAFSILNTLKEKLNLPDYLSERAAYIYRKALEKNIVRGHSVPGMMTASLYAACRETDTNRCIGDFQKASNLQRKEIARDYRTLLKNLNLKISVLDPIKCVSRIGNNLELSERIKRYAIKILEDAELSGIAAGKDPRGMAACALYLACLEFGENRTQKEIGLASDVTEVTVRNRSKELSKKLKLSKYLR